MEMPQVLKEDWHLIQLISGELIQHILLYFIKILEKEKLVENDFGELTLENLKITAFITLMQAQDVASK